MGFKSAGISLRRELFADPLFDPFRRDYERIFVSLNSTRLFRREQICECNGPALIDTTAAVRDF